MESTFSSSLGVLYTAKQYAIETANVIETIESIFKPTVTPYPLQKKSRVSIKRARTPPKTPDHISSKAKEGRKEGREPGRSAQRYRETFDLIRTEV